MAMTRLQCSADLGIVLEGNRTTFRLGETINGYVFRETPAVWPEVVVKVAVCGRYVDRSVRDDFSNGRCDLIESARRASTLFSGTLHIPPGKGSRQEWPFSIRMPTYIEPGAIHNANWLGGLPPTGESIQGQRLPSSVWMRAALKEYYVEYFVQADLWYRSQGSWDNITATVPICIPFIQRGPPLADCKLVVLGMHMSATSHRFLPGMGETKLTTSQRMKNAFNISSAPTYGLKLQMGFPSYIQIGNPGLIPFQVRLVPQWERTSEEIRNILPRARLTGISLELQTHCRTQNQKGPFATDTEYSFTMDLFAEKCALPPPPDLEIPCSEALPPIDIGQCCGLTSPSEASSVLRDGMLTPTFSIFNVSLAHGLAWTLKFEIAGEVLVAEGLQAIVVLPPTDPTDKDSPVPPPKKHSRSYFEMAPPSYDASDLPPAFSEIERDGGRPDRTTDRSLPQLPPLTMK